MRKQLALFLCLLVLSDCTNLRNLMACPKATLAEMGVQMPEIVLPKNIDVHTWATISCDQYTQDREYWNQVYKTVGNKPSTVKITFPEVYLNDDGKEERIADIRKTMKEYIDQGVFEAPQKEFIYLERTTAYGRVRKGIIAAIDLETYEWQPMTTKLTRATEQTILERIPPRVRIRKGAPIETPHIMLLINDPEHQVVEGTGARVNKGKTVYEGEMMMNGGSIKGWAVKNDEDVEHLRASIQKVRDANKDAKGNSFLFAVGDGNHSLATAKTIWEDFKKTHPGVMESKLRYALVEIVNLFDEGLNFEPIHRVIFDIKTEDLITNLKKKWGGNVVEVKSHEELEKYVQNSIANFGFISTVGGKTQYLLLKTPIKTLAVAELQPALDEYLQKNGKKDWKSQIDFIHGTAEVLRLGKQEGATTILLPPIAKDSFFMTIGTKGTLPRKSFSMGEADEKRFYLECRLIE